MNTTNTNVLMLIAGEYVVGTLTGPARRRFERVIATSLEARQWVWQWERDLDALNAQPEDLVPHPDVWIKIEQQINPKLAYSTNRFWRTWSLAVTAAALVLAILLVLPQLKPQVDASASQIALFHDAEDNPLWLISADLRSGKLHAKAVNTQALALDEAYELWMLPNEGPPQSLGLLPVNNAESERILPAGLLALLADAKGLAISREPAGGSPTGSPTTVVYQAALLTL